jgi:hypothetical protein
LCKVSENTYLKIKDIILEKIDQVYDQEYKIGGPGVRIKFDETVIWDHVYLFTLRGEVSNVFFFLREKKRFC